MNPITEQLEQTIQLVRGWPPERQEDAVQILLAMQESDMGIYHLTDEERTSVRLGLEQVRRGETVGADFMESVYKRYGA